MQIEKRLKNHYKRWNIDFSYEEQFLNFKNRLITLLDKSMGDYLAVNPNIDKYFIEVFNIHKADEPIVRKSQLVYQKLLPDTIKYLQASIEYTEKGLAIAMYIDALMIAILQKS